MSGRNEAQERLYNIGLVCLRWLHFEGLIAFIIMLLLMSTMRPAGS